MGSSYHMACPLSKRNANTTVEPLDITTDDLVVEAITIYPNPANTLISAKGIDGYQNYIIYDQLMRIVKQGKILENEISVDDLSDGTYFISFVNEYENSTLKFVVKH
jgi:hypothetical protein